MNGTDADRWVLALDEHPALTYVRRWARDLLADIVEPDMLDDVVLVVDELVTNAEVHTACPEYLIVRHWPGVVQIEVVDRDTAAPVLRRPSPTGSGGRGICLVEAVSTHWGVRRCPDGKAVWSLFWLGQSG